MSTLRKLEIILLWEGLLREVLEDFFTTTSQKKTQTRKLGTREGTAVAALSVKSPNYATVYCLRLYNSCIWDEGSAKLVHDPCLSSSLKHILQSILNYEPLWAGHSCHTSERYYGIVNSVFQFIVISKTVFVLTNDNRAACSPYVYPRKFIMRTLTSPETRR